jgi:uridylate kinase
MSIMTAKEVIASRRTDNRAFLMAEVPGVKSCRIDRNVDGRYTEDFLKNPDAGLIRNITAKEPIRMDPED